jgi:hypothetical protein
MFINLIIYRHSTSVELYDSDIKVEFLNLIKKEEASIGYEGSGLHVVIKIIACIL